MPYKKAGDSWYEVIDQSDLNSCSMACCSMVLRMVRNVSLAEVDLKNESTAWRPQPKEYDIHGATLGHVVDVLAKWKVKGTVYWSPSALQIHSLLAQASRQAPVIVGFIRLPDTSRKHLVVSPGLNKAGTHWVALDPGDFAVGGVASEQPVANLPYYSISGTAGVIDAVITTG